MLIIIDRFNLRETFRAYKTSKEQKESDEAYNNDDNTDINADINYISNTNESNEYSDNTLIFELAPEYAEIDDVYNKDYNNSPQLVILLVKLI